MLSKLLKHDFLDLGKSMLEVCASILGLSLLIRIFKMLSDFSVIFATMSSIATFVLVVAILVGIIYCFFMGIYHFYKKTFKETGYLTNALPVSKNSLLMSKLIAAITYMLILILICIVALLIAFYSPGALENIWNGLSGFMAQFGYSQDNLVSLIVITLVLVFVQYLTTLLGIFCAISIGHSFSTKKLERTFIAAVVIYGIFQVLSIIALFIVLATDGNLLETLNSSDMLPYETFVKIFATFAISNGITIPALYLISKYNLKNKLNIE